ncbi:MAG: hypothetical protein L0J57_09805, partial [Brachybacterium sp.]|nr:hypothetical protein [Brachybacterium sp.]
ALNPPGYELLRPGPRGGQLLCAGSCGERLLLHPAADHPLGAVGTSHAGPHADGSAVGAGRRPGT